MLLQACGAYESYARTRVRAGGPGHVAEFLVLDRLFPRSVRHALAIAEECLVGLEPIATRTRSASSRLPSDSVAPTTRLPSVCHVATVVPVLTSTPFERCMVA